MITTMKIPTNVRRTRSTRRCRRQSSTHSSILKFGTMTPLFAVASLLVLTSTTDVWFAGCLSVVEGFSSPALPPQIRRNALIAPSQRQGQHQQYSQHVVQLFLWEEDNQEIKNQVDGEDAEHDTMLGSYDGSNPFTGQKAASSTTPTPSPFSLTSTTLSPSTSSVRNSSTSTRQISLRNMRMQELITDLLEVVGNAEGTRRVLDDSKDFLLQPLEDQEAVLV